MKGQFSVPKLEYFLEIRGCFRDDFTKKGAVLGKVLVQTGAFVLHTQVTFI